MVLNKCEHEHAYKLAEFFNMCLKNLVFENVGTFCLRSVNLRKLGNGLWLKTIDLLVIFQWLVKSEKIVNIRIFDFLEVRDLFFSGFCYGFMSSESTENCLTVVSDRTAKFFSKPVTTRAVVHDNAKAFHRIGNASFLHKLMSYGIS